MNDSELEFYKRQITLPDFGLEGQEKLKQAKVLIVGVGGLGSPALQYLSAAGIGNLGICDFDIVDLTNLHRQIIFEFDQARQSKVESAKSQIEKFNPFVNVEVIPGKISADNVERIIGTYDVVLDCTDNFSTKFLLHDACYLNKINLVQASIYQYEGQLQVFRFADDIKSGCYRCLWQKIPDENCVGTCGDVGVLGVVPGIFGTMQALETIKIIVGWKGIEQNESFVFDLRSLDSRKIKWKKKKGCPLCGDDPKIINISNNEYESIEEYEIRAKSFNLNNYILVDIREVNEQKEDYLKDKRVTSIPNSSLKISVPDLDPELTYIFFCDHGITSKKIVKELRAKGLLNTFSLKDGINGVKKILVEN
jgi:sulfur-carrier protein adenylyltransferase/sulfurtransferase